MKKSIFWVIGLIVLCLIESNTVVYAEESNLSDTKQQKDEDDWGGCPIFGDIKYFEHHKTFDKLKSKKWEQCLKNADEKDTSTFQYGFDARDCNNEEFVRQDSILNKKYQKLIKVLPKNESAELKKFQRKWIKERNRVSECIYPADAGVASLFQMEESSFRLFFTVQRISEFDQCLSAKKISRNSKGCENLYPLK